VNTVTINRDLIRVLPTEPVKTPSIDLIATLFSDLMRQIYNRFSEVVYTRIIPDDSGPGFMVNCCLAFRL